MPLISSVSGIRGTIGGSVGQALTPFDIVRFTTAFGRRLVQQSDKHQVVIGRDARVSGPLISQLVGATLQALGIAVLDVGLSTTPTVALATAGAQAGGGIVITASHNPIAWNALKLLNADGTCLDQAAMQEVTALADEKEPVFVTGDQLGSYSFQAGALEKHIAQIVALPLVDVPAIQQRRFRVAVEGMHSSGGMAVPKLLQALGVAYCKEINCQPTGHFAHDPEPVAENLTDLTQVLQTGDYTIGFAVDPDVDRLAIVDEKGCAWGEDYTLVAVADYVLRKTPGTTVTNVTTSQAFQDITLRYGKLAVLCPVGEAHVVAHMKEHQAVLGGEGSGGVIYPPLHYNRDALVGIALILSYLAQSGHPPSYLRALYPSYALVRKKIPLAPDVDVDQILTTIRKGYVGYPIQSIDGLAIQLPTGRIQVRPSNTEPVLRIQAEAIEQKQAVEWVTKIVQQLAGS